MQPERKQRRLSLRVPESMATRFKELAAEEERTPSAEIRLLMRRRIEAADREAA
jgi:predicted DNA-binding protein